MYHISKYQYNNLEKQFLCLRYQIEVTEELNLSLHLFLTALIQYRDITYKEDKGELSGPTFKSDLINMKY